MDKHKALNILFEAAKLANMNYQSHALSQQAYDILSKELTPKKEKTPKE